MVVADKVPEAAREAELRDDFKVDLGRNDDEGCEQQGWQQEGAAGVEEL